jgi:hypothetical protein
VAAWIVRHTVWGEAGMGTSFTPSPDRASTMALMTAGAAPMVPASPMPFTPSGLVGEGVTVWSVTIDGTSEAAGIR